MIDGTTTLARRLERYRAALPTVLPPAAIDARDDTGPPQDLATRLAAAVDGEVIVTPEGRIVRCEMPQRTLPVDRVRLATLPGQPPPDVPLVCLDTETTGLATAAGTAAFLVGLGWWEARDRYRQVQLMLPDHGEERALLTAIEAAIPPAAWLVTYNGRGFDWPLLTTRFRLARRAAPPHAGHLDLLPVVRRLFRHRMADARLRTAEAELLGLHRIGDVEGWEIPGRYHEFLRGGSARPLAEVARHNDQDVRSLAWILAHLAERYGDPAERVDAPPGDLAGLARSFAREHRLAEALDCLEAAADRPIARTVVPKPTSAVAAQRPEDVPWWSPLRPADFGGRQRAPSITSGTPQGAALAAPWTTERIAVDRAHMLRRLGRYGDAADAWTALVAGPGRVAIVAAIELAKLREHRLRDRPGALDAVTHGLEAIERRRRLGRPEPALEVDLARRAMRLRRRLGPRLEDAAPTSSS
ncbi:MAG: ribonuclease H-like domain-containing protein [Chloroflexota bacterium]